MDFIYDLVVIGAHPDDQELGAGGIIAKHVHKGLKVGIVDLTKGEMGTRGNAETRTIEANASAKVLGVSTRVQMNLSDGFIDNSKENKLAVAKVLRELRPKIVLLNAPQDKHPDHVHASRLTLDAMFLAGLNQIVIEGDNGENLPFFRVKNAYHYIQDYNLEPDFYIDISEHMEVKRLALACYQSQFYNPNSDEPNTSISSPYFLKNLEGRALVSGREISVPYAEGLIKTRAVGINWLTDLI